MFGEFSLKISVGQGASARVPWIAIHTSEMKISEVFMSEENINRKIAVIVVADVVGYSKQWKDENSTLKPTQSVNRY